MCVKISLPQRTQSPQREKLKISVRSVALHTALATSQRATNLT